MAILQKKIETDMAKAMKDREQNILSTLRMLKSDMQYEMTKTGAKELDDSQVETLLKRAVKKRKESIEQFEKANREDLLEKEKLELTILEGYLPPSVSEQEIQAVILKVFAEIKPKGPQEIGKVMGSVMGAFKGKNVDGNLVKNLIQNSFPKDA